MDSLPVSQREGVPVCCSTNVDAHARSMQRVAIPALATTVYTAEQTKQGRRTPKESLSIKVFQRWRENVADSLAFC